MQIVHKLGLQYLHSPDIRTTFASKSVPDTNNGIVRIDWEDKYKERKS